VPPRPKLCPINFLNIIIKRDHLLDYFPLNPKHSNKKDQFFSLIIYLKLLKVLKFFALELFVDNSFCC